MRVKKRKHKRDNNGISLDSPDALAKIVVSLKDKAIIDVKLKNDSREDVSPGNVSRRMLDNIRDDKTIDLMWSLLNSSKIDISLACVGYSFDGRSVLDYKNFVDLLVSYGFSSKDAIMFIDDFSKSTINDSMAPIVMTDANTARILTTVEHII
jgi:hypothetical protein